MSKRKPKTLDKNRTDIINTLIAENCDYQSAQDIAHGIIVAFVEKKSKERSIDPKDFDWSESFSPNEVYTFAKNSNLFKSKIKYDNSLLRNNHLYNGNGTEGELADNSPQIITRTINLGDAAAAVLANLVCRLPYSIKFGKATIICDPNATEDIDMSLEEFQILIVHATHKVLEDYGHDPHGIIDAIKRQRRNGPRYRSLLEYHSIVYAGGAPIKSRGKEIGSPVIEFPGISYKKLLAEKKTLDEKEISVYNFLMETHSPFETPRTIDNTVLNKPRGNAGNFKDQLNYYTVHGFFTVDKLTGALVWHSRKSKKFYDSRPNFKKFPYIGFKKAI